jgi:hypothetical protein
VENLKEMKNRAFNASPNIERVKWNLIKESEKVRIGRVFFFFLLFKNGRERVRVVMMIELNELNGKVERMEH